jgi:hypothetical protein
MNTMDFNPKPGPALDAARRASAPLSMPSLEDIKNMATIAATLAPIVNIVVKAAIAKRKKRRKERAQHRNGRHPQSNTLQPVLEPAAPRPVTTSNP